MLKHIYNFIDKIKEKLSQKGQGMVEYALIIAFVAAIAFVARLVLIMALEPRFKMLFPMQEIRLMPKSIKLKPVVMVKDNL